MNGLENPAVFTIFTADLIALALWIPRLPWVLTLTVTGRAKPVAGPRAAISGLRVSDGLPALQDRLNQIRAQKGEANQVMANQPLGTVERLTRWGLMPFISLCLSSAEEGVEKPNWAIFELALREPAVRGARGNDRRPARQRYPPRQVPRLANNACHARLCAIPVAAGRLGRSRSNRGKR